MKTRIGALLLVSVGALAPAAQKPEPQFAAGNVLVRPEGYREWVFVGASLGLTYSKGPSEDAPDFHNVYIQPEAYREFAATGKFPDHTTLVSEIVSSSSKSSINKLGHFEDRFVGIDVAIKDEKRFPEKWAYFSFAGPGGKALAKTDPFPKMACWSCHNQHGAVDNVFVQFYPVLRAAHPLSGEAGSRFPAGDHDR
jgi:cytochrome P460